MQPAASDIPRAQFSPSPRLSRAEGEGVRRYAVLSGKLRIAVALLVLLASGCTKFTDYIHQNFKVGPNYARPPAPVAEHWIDEHDRRLSTESGDDSHWWGVFGDPVLNGLVESAYRQNLTLREAGFRVLQSRAEYIKSIGTFFPQTQEFDGAYANDGLSNNVANRQFLPQKFYTQWNASFALAWELDFWGRFRRAIEASGGDLDASVEEYDAVLVTLVADVAQTYVQLREIEQQLMYVRANVKLQEETLAIASARFKGGLVSELDVDQAQSLLSQTEAQVPQFEISYRQAQNRLCFLLGMPTEDLQARLGSAPIPTAPPQIAVGIPAELLRRRPDIRRMERLAAAQSARIGVAESDFYPSVSIGGTAGYAAENFPDMFTGSSFEGGGGPSFQWKILNYGRILSTVRLHEWRFDEYVTRYQNSVLQANEEVENALVLFLLSHQQAKYLAESVKAAERAVNVAMSQYESGLIDFNRVSLLQQNLVDQQNLFAQAYANIAEGLVQTYRALGGGWQIRLAEEGELPAVISPPQPEDAPGPPDEVIPKPQSPPPANMPAPVKVPQEVDPNGLDAPLPPLPESLPMGPKDAAPLPNTRVVPMPKVDTLVPMPPDAPPVPPASIKVAGDKAQAIKASDDKDKNDKPTKDD